MKPGQIDGPVHTLGPAGTDASSVAAKLTDDVHLEPSFRAALVAAIEDGSYALVSAGYVDLHDGNAGFRDDWVSMNFEYTDSAAIVDVWVEPTRPMAMVIGAWCSSQTEVTRVALHPATRYYADTFLPRADKAFVSAKPHALSMLRNREVDACITSLDLATEFEDVWVAKVFTPSMIWALYASDTTTHPRRGR